MGVAEKLIEKVAEPVAEKVFTKLTGKAVEQQAGKAAEEALANAAKSGGDDALKAGDTVASKAESEAMVAATERVAARNAEQHALEDAAEKGAKDTAEEAAKKSRLSRTGQWMKDHKIKTAAIGAAGLATAGLATAGAVAHELHSLAHSPGPLKIDDAVNRFTNAGQQAAESLADKQKNGIVEFDPEVIRAFAAELRRTADELGKSGKQMTSAIEDMAKEMSVDELGAATRDAAPSPVYRDFVEATGEMNDQFAKLVKACQKQLTDDAARLDNIANTQEETQRTHAAQMSNVDTALV